ncbi:unnamed protein product, partial [Candidula unifasciata]
MKQETETADFHQPHSGNNSTEEFSMKVEEFPMKVEEFPMKVEEFSMEVGTSDSVDEGDCTEMDVKPRLLFVEDT